MVYPINELGRACENRLGFTEAQAIAVFNNGWENYTDLTGFTTKDIQHWAKQMASIPATRGGCLIATVRVNRLCGLSHWMNRRVLRGVPIVEADFTDIALTTAIADFPIHDMEKEASPSVDKPDSFSYEKWEDWQDCVITYLKGKRNVTKDVSLYYVIRPDTPPSQPTEDEDITFHAPHTGAAYTTDNRTVHQLLTELTTGTDADHWIKQFKRAQDGRRAWNELINHYDGPAEGDKRVTIARSDLSNLHYKNETSFNFEKFSTRMKKSFSTLAQYGQPKCEKEKVEMLLKQINNNDTRIVTAIGICRDRHSGTFEDACTYMSQQIAIIYPQQQPNAFGKKDKVGRRPNFRNVNSVKTGKNGKTMCNGVDLTDTTRYFSNKEFTKLGQEGRAYLQKCPKRKAFVNDRKKSKKPKGTNDNSNQSYIAAIINGVVQASRHESDSVAGSSIPSQITGSSRPQHGPHARQAATTSSVRSRGPLRFDHEGNIID